MEAVSTATQLDQGSFVAAGVGTAPRHLTTLLRTHGGRGRSGCGFFDPATTAKRDPQFRDVPGLMNFLGRLRHCRGMIPHG